MVLGCCEIFPGGSWSLEFSLQDGLLVRVSCFESL